MSTSYRNTRIAVCSRSFSRNVTLRRELEARFSSVKFNDEGLSLVGDSLVEFLADSDMAITALEKIDEYVIAKLPNLKRISKYGVGLDMIDVDGLTRYGKQLAWKSGVNRRAVAELALTMMMTILRKIPDSQRQIAAGMWTQPVGKTLSGKTVGIVGCGNIGKDLVQLLQPFECKILVHDIQRYPDFFGKYLLSEVTLEELVSASDIVTLHVPLDDSTRKIISIEKLTKFKKGSILINTARGGLIDETALLDAIRDKRIAGIGLDVFEEEPPFGSELLLRPEVFTTPHIGGSAEEAIIAMGLAAIEGLAEDCDSLIVG